ncbi:response regulator [Trinickia sp. NRRL B-1857]|uniref:response regulator transcription factor n=1 Tax=Trinickia sp. NRRL B-1857 TaxID=3162879 RepID=UPI003D27E38A
MSVITSMPRRGRECLEPLVYVLDDDPDMNDALVDLLHSVGMRTTSFSSAETFLSIEIGEEPSCLVLDVRLRGANGLDVQQALKRRDIDLPIVFITGYGDIEMTVQAMKAGAVDFLTKPFRDQALLDAVAQAIAVDRKTRRAARCGDDLRGRYATLTDREREVMMLAVSGLMNKQIAGEIGISEVTVKVHRGRVMRKMSARTFADLVKMSIDIDRTARHDRASSAPAPRYLIDAAPQSMATSYG